MRFHAVLVLAAAGRLLFAQAETDPEMIRAKAEIEKIRALVEAGAAPRAQLRKAEDAVADAQDAALLRKTLYGKDLSEAQSDDMLAAADRRLERRRAAFDAAQKLVATGAAAAITLDPLRREVDLAAKERTLAESRADLVKEMAQMAQAEEMLALKLSASPSEAQGIAERYDGDGVFNMVIFADVQEAFERQFHKSLPVSAMGETAVHRALGFNHTGRVDVAVSPEDPEGGWLRTYLMMKHIPFFAFKQAIPGKATGAHIHLGPISTRLSTGG
jgi:hypothetical protein